MSKQEREQMKEKIEQNNSILSGDFQIDFLSLKWGSLLHAQAFCYSNLTGSQHAK